MSPEQHVPLNHRTPTLRRAQDERILLSFGRKSTSSEAGSDQSGRTTKQQEMQKSCDHTNLSHNFLQRGNTLRERGNGVASEGDQPLLHRSISNLRGVGLVIYQLSQTIAHWQYLEDPCPASVPRVPALRTSQTSMQNHRYRQSQTCLHFLRYHVLTLAVLADRSHQPLRHYKRYRRTHQIRFNAHVSQPRDRRWRVVSMQRAQNQCPVSDERMAISAVS